MNNKTFLTFLLLYTLLACSKALPSPQPSPSIINNSAILSEILRLDALKENITVADVGTLQTVLSSDAYASDEMNQIQTMVKYHEYEHVGHSLGILGVYVSSGKHLLCPGHALSHYYIFMKHGEADLANGALIEAKTTFPIWLPKTREAERNTLSAQEFDTAASQMQTYFDNIEAGNTTFPSDEGLKRLSDAPCI